MGDGAITTEFKPQVGLDMLEAWANAKGPSIVDGSQAKQGLLALLSKAELHAAAKGFAVPISNGTGEGVQLYMVGGGTAKAKQLAAQGNTDAIVYLAAQQAARRANAEIIPTSDPLAVYTVAPESIEPLANADSADPQIVPAIAPAIIAAIVITVVAVAAAVAVVAWASATKVQVQQQTQQRLALADQALDAASSGKKLDPNYWKVLQQMAGAEQSESGGNGIPWGLIAIGGLGLGAYKLLTKE